MTVETVNPHYTTGAIIGGVTVGNRQPVGWEAIQPKRTSKPAYLLKAQQAVQAAWADYLWHIDAGADQGTLEALYTDYDKAKRECEASWEAAERGWTDYNPKVEAWGSYD